MKLSRLFTYALLLFLVSCNNSNNNNKNSELELKKKELELKDRELKLKESEKEDKKNISSKKEQKLRYLYWANGGIWCYFDDNTFSYCPRCDFCKTNIMSMFGSTPDGVYIVMEDGTLLINNNEQIVPANTANDNGWALIDYVWNQKVPQF